MCLILYPISRSPSSFIVLKFTRMPLGPNTETAKTVPSPQDLSPLCTRTRRSLLLEGNSIHRRKGWWSSVLSSSLRASRTTGHIVQKNTTQKQSCILCPFSTFQRRKYLQRRDAHCFSSLFGLFLTSHSLCSKL